MYSKNKCLSIFFSFINYYSQILPLVCLYYYNVLHQLIDSVIHISLYNIQTRFPVVLGITRYSIEINSNFGKFFHPSLTTSYCFIAYSRLKFVFLSS